PRQPARPATPAAKPAQPQKDARKPAQGALDPNEYPLLCLLGRNLTERALDGKVDPVVGRDKEVERIVDILGKRRANNPCLVGEPGVGKTAIVEGLARKLALREEGAAGLHDRVIVELETGSIVAGTQLRGSLSERLNGLKEELRKAGGRIIVFIDELHTLIGAGSTSDGGNDAANELKAALARGEFPCIGATTHAEYKKHIAQDPALERRFVPVHVMEPDNESALKIVEGAAKAYEEHHRVSYDATALRASVQLSARFVHDRFLPGKAIDLIDLAGSRARRHGKDTVDRTDVARVVSEVADVPLDRLLTEDQVRFLHMEEFLGERIVGHRAVIKLVGEAIRRAYAGFSTNRPMASFLFLGPTGVGKTETVKALADFLFGSKDAVVRLDMSEYAEAHAISRLVGSPPGYVGHDEGGQLTDAIRRRPYSLVLLDEIEKAHRDVLLNLLQVLDEGRLTDAKGRTVSFRNAVIVMTSNLGAERFESTGRALGFAAAGSATPAGDSDATARDVLEAARKAMPPELWARIDERVVFHPLTAPDVEQIARQMLAESARRLELERGIHFSAGDDVIAHLMAQGGYNARLGARPMRQAVQRHVEAAVADGILAGRFKEGDKVRVLVEDGKVRVTREAATAEAETPA
ncbi:MAG: ATP-dependent Clp protease ATP-binding subunit, partial [Myxococcota bacterium]